MEIFTKAVPIELDKLASEGGSGRFQGYASKFDGEDSYGDTILPGAYTPALKALGKSPLPIFFNHDSMDVPIGKFDKIEQNDHGLYVKGSLTLSIGRAQEVYEAMKAGTVSGLSVGIGLTRDDYDWKDDGMGRIIKSVSLLREISICNFPADSKARISVVKSEDIDGINTIRDLELSLRDSGFSKSQALAFIAKARSLFDAQRDSEIEKQKLQAALDRLNSHV